MAIACVLLVIGACEEPAPVKIGFVGAFEGRSADLSREGRNGALLAVEQVNAAGGINGRPVELVVRDDRNDSTTAAVVDQELIDEGVAAIVGHMTSQMSVAGVPVADRNRVVLLSPTASTSDLSGIDDFFLRVYPANAGDAMALATLAHDQLGVRRVAVALDTGNRAHGATWLGAFKEGFERLKGEIAVVEEFTSSQSLRLAKVAGKLLQKQPDAVFVLAGALDTGLLCQHLREGGFHGPILVSQWSVTPDIFAHAGAAADGIYFIDTYDRENRAPAFLDFKERFGERFRSEPGFSATFSYEGTMILLEGLKKTTVREDLKDTLIEIGEFAGLQSTIAFSRYGDVTRPRYFRTVRDGRFVDVE